MPLMTARIVNSGLAADQTWTQSHLTGPTSQARRGDLIIAYTWGLDLTVSNSSGPTWPEFMTEVFRDDVTPNGFNVIRAGFVTEKTLPELRLTRGSGQNYGAWGVATWVVRGVSKESGWLEDVEVNNGVFGSSLPFAEQVAAGDDRLALRLMFGFSVTTSPEPPGLTTVSDGSYDVQSLRMSIPGGYAFSAWAGKTTDDVAGEVTLTTPLPPDENASMFVAGVSLLLVSAPTPKVLPSQPAPQRLRLDCARDYGVWITDASYRTTLKKVEWNAVSWERVLDDISAANATIPDTPYNWRCLTDLGGLVPWEYGILIERDSELVWSGPITSIMRDGDTLRVGASDVLSRFQKLPAIWGEPVEYEGVDSAQILADIINIHSFSPANPWHLTAPDFNVDAPLTRELRASQEELAWSVIAEILDSAVDMYVIGNTLYCWDVEQGWVYHNGRRTEVLPGPYNASRDFVYGVFTREAFKQRPDWSIAGGDQVNYFVALPADVGQAGFRERFVAEDVASQSRVGVLFGRDPNPLHLPADLGAAERDAVYQRRADGYLALHRKSPAILSSQPLAVGAPIDVANLRPGSIWMVDVDDFGFTQGLQATRLKRVSVSVSKASDGGIVEDVTPTIYPVGYEAEGL